MTKKKKKQSAWPTSSFQPKAIVIHTPSKLRVYCSIEFSTLFIRALAGFLPFTPSRFLSCFFFGEKLSPGGSFPFCVLHNRGVKVFDGVKKNLFANFAIVWVWGAFFCSHLTLFWWAQKLFKSNIFRFSLKKRLFMQKQSQAAARLRNISLCKSCSDAGRVGSTQNPRNVNILSHGAPLPTRPS